jgi:hypothetical protein
MLMSTAILVLLVLNIALQLIVVLALLRRAYGNRLEFGWQTTFFGKTRHGFTLTWWDHRREEYPNYGKTFFRFSWRDPNTIPDRPYIEDAAKWARPRFSWATG